MNLEGTAEEVCFVKGFDQGWVDIRGREKQREGRGEALGLAKSET